MYYSVVMEMRDPSRERERLRDEYSRMMDGELEQLLLHEVDLTEPARQVLKEEMSVRGLSQQPPQPKAGNAALISSGSAAVPALSNNNPGDQSDLCVVRSFASFPEALVARGLLDISFGELNDAAKISLPLGLPLPIRRHDWTCHKCGTRWSDSEQD